MPLPAEGPATAQRTGAALINGKMRLNGIAPLPNGTTRSEFYLWHYYGDPSMQMWGGGHAPFVIDVNALQAVFATQGDGPPPPDPPPYFVNVTLPAGLDGQPISLLRNGEVVGKTTIGGNAASIPATFDDSQPLPGELSIALAPDGYMPASKPVDGVPPPPPPPPPPKTDTTVSQTCPNTGPNSPSPFSARVTTQGTIWPAFAGAAIKLTYTRPDATTFERTVTTNANGGWSDTIVPGDEKGQARTTVPAPERSSRASTVTRRTTRPRPPPSA